MADGVPLQDPDFCEGCGEEDEAWQNELQNRAVVEQLEGVHHLQQQTAHELARLEHDHRTQGSSLTDFARQTLLQPEELALN
eukprot:CAMPEP_0116900324 /NCGR_PEP_ID=MMETSP0467-20121206/8635_1 /TAXON_ID=283647 /ORGANISM="Mesodinium pulex, Strain SPMC105" /LENGTH=81 /DNA_ID=CAMNT_0004573515 /DNA_START=878 /DNA_END=1123 /DNA_ORIENTATION=-